ncbi:hypothetical protein GC163_22295 [bacterium]|nr:hypothetical protein [bacterium]
MSQWWLAVALVISSGLAYVWPAGWFDPLTASAPWLGGLIALTMFAVGSLLPVDEIRQIGRRWPTVLFGTVVQYTVMPLLAYTIGRAFQFDAGTLAGVILVGCVPGAMASNVLTMLARGNTSYSVSLTTLATLASPVTVPLALWLTLDTQQDSNFAQVAITLLWQVVAPVILGFSLCRVSLRFQSLMQVLGPIIANLVILWIIAAVVAINRQRLTAVDLNLLLALFLINVGGYFAGYYSGAMIRLDEGMRRALTIEVGMQNCGLGTTLALSLFPGTPAAIPTAVYTFGCMLTGTLLATWWSNRAPNALLTGAVNLSEAGP